MRAMEKVHRVPKLNHRQEFGQLLKFSSQLELNRAFRPGPRRQLDSRAPRRVELQALGPADNSHIQEGGALRRGSAFPKNFKYPGSGPFRMRRSNEARACDIEPSRSYIQHADIQANDPDWEESELPWNPVTMGRYEGKQRTFTTPAKKFPGAQFIVKQAAEGRSLAKYTTKELSVKPEEEHERSTRFAIQVSPSWSEVQPIKDMSVDKYIVEVAMMKRLYLMKRRK